MSEDGKVPWFTWILLVKKPPGFYPGLQVFFNPGTWNQVIFTLVQVILQVKKPGKLTEKISR